MRRWGIALVVALIVLWVMGQIFAKGAVTAQCAPLDGACTVTVINESFWPYIVDSTGVRVNGTPAQAVGSPWVGPFGAATLQLAHTDGTLVRSLDSVDIPTGPLLGPTTIVHLEMQPRSSVP